MPDPRQDAVKIGSGEHRDVSVEVWSGPAEPQLCLLSFSAGNAHFVVTLHSRAMVKMMRDFIVTHRGQTGAEWLEIGVFAACPVNVYSNKDGTSLICDGSTVAGYPTSFAVYFAELRLDCFCSALTEIVLQIEQVSNDSP